MQNNFSSACFIKELYDIITRYNVFTHIYGNYVNAHLMFCNYSKYTTILTNHSIKNSNSWSEDQGEKTLTPLLPSGLAPDYSSSFLGCLGVLCVPGCY